jgi:transketolase
MITKALAMRDVFLEKIWQEMSVDSSIFFITADFGSPVLDKIRNDFPNRFVNVGVAEQNLINITAGIAIEGFKVFAYAIAPFITMRCFEQIRVSLALLSEVRPMNVTLIGVGAGYSYVVSGPTHQCYEDITIMRALPNFQVLSPSDHVSAGEMFANCLNNIGLKYLRFDAQILPVIYAKNPPLISTGFHVHNKGNNICIVATGFMMKTALRIVNDKLSGMNNIGLIDFFDLSCYSKDKLLNEIKSYNLIVSLEEGFSGRGGLDAMLNEFILKNDLNIKVFSIGVDPCYSFALGTRDELHEEVGIGYQAVKNKISLLCK